MTLITLFDSQAHALNVAPVIHRVPASMELPIDKYRVPSQPLWKVTPRERKFLQKISAESVVGIYPGMQVYLIDREKTVVDPLLNEVEDPVYLPPVTMHAYVQWSPTEKLLKTFGLEKIQTPIMTTSYDHLKNLGVTDLYNMTGAVVYVRTDGRRLTEYDVISAHKRPQDAVLFGGDILNVAIKIERRTQSPFPEEETNLPTEITAPDPLIDHTLIQPRKKHGV